MATAKKRAAAKTKAKNVKRDAKRIAAKSADSKPKSEKPAPKPKAATKAPKKKAPRKQVATKQPSLGRTVNLGPLRGDNSFPPGNKPMSQDRSRAPKGSPAKDSTTGPGGTATEGRSKDTKRA